MVTAELRVWAIPTNQIRLAFVETRMAFSPDRARLSLVGLAGKAVEYAGMGPLRVPHNEGHFVIVDNCCGKSVIARDSFSVR